MTARSHSRTGFEVILGANFARAVDPPGKSTHLRPPQRIEARWRSGDVEDCKSSSNRRRTAIVRTFLPISSSLEINDLRANCELFRGRIARARAADIMGPAPRLVGLSMPTSVHKPALAPGPNAEVEVQRVPHGTTFGTIKSADFRGFGRGGIGLSGSLVHMRASACARKNTVDCPSTTSKDRSLQNYSIKKRRITVVFCRPLAC